MDAEPIIKVGIIENVDIVKGTFNGNFILSNSIIIKGNFTVKYINNNLILFDEENIEVTKNKNIYCKPINNSTFTLNNVVIGKQFHWERSESQTFEGDILFIANKQTNDKITVINEIPLEKYLTSVISSEMNSVANEEFLKAHAITSRSWIMAMLQNKIINKQNAPNHTQSENEIIKWYDIENHNNFDVCADDHCQRYQGITKIFSETAINAVNSTRGIFLLSEDKICDARFSKCCGGITELFENNWQDEHKNYLESVYDYNSNDNYNLIKSEEDAIKWIKSEPNVYCNTQSDLLKKILPNFDSENLNYFRWTVEYTQQDLQSIINNKSGMIFGDIIDIIPLQRGPSARIYKLKIIGTQKNIILGKELEIRKWLSKTHLYSGAFAIEKQNIVNSIPQKFVIYGAGWGHGVGLCQIGAAIMAENGFNYKDILYHYFKNANINKLY